MRLDVTPPPHPVEKECFTHVDGAYGTDADPTIGDALHEIGDGMNHIGDGLDKIGGGITSISSGIAKAASIISNWCTPWSTSPTASADPQIAKVRTNTVRSADA
jgi:hypothetical protein